MSEQSRIEIAEKLGREAVSAAMASQDHARNGEPHQSHEAAGRARGLVAAIVALVDGYPNETAGLARALARHADDLAGENTAAEDDAE